MSSILDLPDLLIKKGLPFVIYSLPEADSCKIIFQKDPYVKYTEILDIEDVSGFVIADFESARTGIADIIIPDFILTEADNIDEAVKFLSSLPVIVDYSFSELTYICKGIWIKIWILQN